MKTATWRVRKSPKGVFLIQAEKITIGSCPNGSYAAKLVAKLNEAENGK